MDRYDTTSSRMPRPGNHSQGIPEDAHIHPSLQILEVTRSESRSHPTEGNLNHSKGIFEDSQIHPSVQILESVTVANQMRTTADNPINETIFNLDDVTVQQCCS